MSHFDMTGRVVLITGGSRGLGRAMALGFAGAGADIAIASRKLDSCESAAREVEAIGRRALAHACHVGNWDDLEVLIDAVYEHFGRVDVLVNNAGMSPLASSSLTTPEALYDKVLDVNLKGPFRLTALVGSRMVAGDGGSIINVSSTASIRPTPSTAPYAAAKAGLNAITVAYAHEYGLPIVAGRFFNVTGPRQSAEYGAVVPTFCGQALRGGIGEFGEYSRHLRHLNRGARGSWRRCSCRRFGYRHSIGHWTF